MILHVSCGVSKHNELNGIFCTVVDRIFLRNSFRQSFSREDDTEKQQVVSVRIEKPNSLNSNLAI